MRSRVKFILYSAIAAAPLSCVSLSAQTFPTTQPAYDPPSVTYGWNLRDAGLPNPYATTQPAPTTGPTTNPASQPTTAPATRPTTQPTTLPATISLNAILAAAPPGTQGSPNVIYLPSGAYTLQGMFTPPAWVTVDGTGSTLVVASQGNNPLDDILKITNPGFVLQKFADIHGVGLLMDVYSANCRLKYNSISMIDRAVQTDASETGFVSLHNNIHANGVGMYFTGSHDTTAQDTIWTGGEYGVRIELQTVIEQKATGPQLTGTPAYQADGKTVARASFATVAGDIFLNLPAFGKQNVGSRWGDNTFIGATTIVVDGQTIVCAGNQIYEIRAGELATDLTGPLKGYTGSCGSNLKIVGNTFLGVNVGNCPISVDLGMSTATNPFAVTGNTFTDAICAAGVGPVGSSSPFTVQNNVQWLAKGFTAATIKPIIANSVKTLGTNLGGNIVIQPPTTAPIPTTFPATQNAGQQ